MKRTRKNRRLRAALSAAVLSVGVTQAARAQLSVPLSSGFIYSQNFNTLAVSGSSNNASTLPIGFAFSESGTGNNITYAAGDGSITTPNTYSFGTGTNTERALGEITGVLQSTIGCVFRNATGSTLGWITVAYTGEQWSLGDSAAPIDKLDFQYSTTASTINSGTYTDVNALDFSSPNNSSIGPLNGNSAANRTVIGPISFAATVAPDGLFFLRWVPLNAAGVNDGLAIDDFQISISPIPTAGLWTGGTGSWSTSLKWSDGVIPNNSAVPVKIDNGNPTASLVTLDQDATVGTIAIAASDTLNINATRTLTITGTGGSSLATGALNNDGAIDVQAGTTKLMAGGTHGGTFHVASGATLEFGGGTHTLTNATPLNGAGTLAISAGAVDFGGAPTITTLQLSGSGLMKLSGLNKTLKVATISALGTSKLDLKDNKAVITAAQIGSLNGSTYTGVSGLVQAGRNGGTWNGTGIITSMPDALNFKTTLAVASAAEALGLQNSATKLWGGQTVGSGDILVMYTYAGDLNVDGTINADDYAYIDLYFKTPGAFGYTHGDINYSGTITADDYALIDANFINGGTTFAVRPLAQTTASRAVVPEPAFGAFSILLLPFLKRRRTAHS